MTVFSTFLELFEEIQRKGRTPARLVLKDEQNGPPGYGAPNPNLFLSIEKENEDPQKGSLVHFTSFDSSAAQVFQKN